MISLSHLFSIPRPDDAVVATDGKRQIDWRTYVHHVAGLARRIDAAGSGEWLIAEADAYKLSVGIFAAFQADARPVLPANLQPGHLADIASGLDGVVSDAHRAAGARAVLSVLGEPGSDFEAPPLRPDAARFEVILHTSGTTGAPVRLRKPLRCFEAELASLSAAFSPEEGTSVFSTVPPYHIYGLLFRVFWPLATGRPFAADTIAYPEDLLSAATNSPGATLVSSPAYLSRALAVLDLDRLKRCLGPVFSSGGPLPPEIAAAYNAVLEKPVTEVYGSTETGGIAYRSVRDAAETTLWQPLPQVEVAVAQGRDVLTVRSPFMTQPNWYETSDRVRIGEDDRFELLGRADRIVKVEEQRVSLTEVEKRLSECEMVDRAKVLSFRGERSGRQALAAVVEPAAGGWAMLSRDGRRVFARSLSDRLRPYVPSVAIPRRWRFVSTLPEDDRGKISDAALQALFTESSNRREAPEITSQRITGDSARLQLHLPEDLHYFDGHFDVAPILAGVVQVNWAIRFGQALLAVPQGFRRIEALKFFNVLRAGTSVTLNLDYKPEASCLSFEFKDATSQFSSGRVIFDTAR